MATKYYSIVSGKNPGIYTDWSMVQKILKETPGAIFKTFTSLSEAQKFRQTANTKRNILEFPIILPLTNKTIVYTSSYYMRNSSGFGVLIITNKGDELTANGRVPLPPSNNIAELYATYVALSLVSGDIAFYSDSEFIVNCLTIYIHEWYKNNFISIANSQLVKAIYSLLVNRNITIHLYKNINKSQNLAQNGCFLENNLIITKNGILQPNPT